jgi:hypothetical protein
VAVVDAVAAWGAAAAGAAAWARFLQRVLAQQQWRDCQQLASTEAQLPSAGNCRSCHSQPTWQQVDGAEPRAEARVAPRGLQGAHRFFPLHGQQLGTINPSFGPVQRTRGLGWASPRQQLPPGLGPPRWPPWPEWPDPW